MAASPAEQTNCEVTVIDPAGKRWTMQVKATSLYNAVFVYNAQQVSGFHRDYPVLTRKTEIEVKLLRDGRVLNTTFAKAMDWANADAARRLRNRKGR